MSLTGSIYLIDLPINAKKYSNWPKYTGLLNYVPHEFVCLMCLMSYVFSCFTCLTFSRVLGASCPTCPRTSRASCHTCPRSRRVSCLTCSHALRTSCVTCPRASRVLCALLLHSFCDLCARVVLVPYVLLRSSSLTCFRCFKSNTHTHFMSHIFMSFAFGTFGVWATWVS